MALVSIFTAPLKPTVHTYDALVEILEAEFNVGVVCTLREVYLTAHTKYKRETREKLGVDKAVERTVLGLTPGVGMPMDVWTSVGKLSPDKAGALVDWANQRLWDGVKLR